MPEMLLEAFSQSLHNLARLDYIGLVSAGVVIGLVFGIIPGIGGILALALLLPFILKMAPVAGLPFLIGIYCASFTGGSMIAILLNIPGDEANAATLIDGFPLAQKGEAGRAIGAALGSSGLGGVASGFLALLMIPLVIPMILWIRTSDMVAIVVMGLSFIAVLAGRSKLKGLISGGLGLLVGFMGFQASTGEPRFTFGSVYLYEGMGIIPVALGVFALPEMISLAASGSTVSKAGSAMQGLRGIWGGFVDVFRHWGIWLRSTVIGYVVGVIPGIGASVAIWIAYGQAKQVSRNPERYGTGAIEGVIAPEAANNAVAGGGLLTTLALGIPGSGSMAILIGAMMMLGITPGPAMLSADQLALSLTLLHTVILSNIIAAMICFSIAPQLAKVVYVPNALLFPVVMALLFVGSFATRMYFADMITTMCIGVIGLFLKDLGYSRSAFFLAYVLGDLFEKYFFISLRMSGPLFFLTPVSLMVIFIMIGLFSFHPIKRSFERKRIRSQGRASKA